MADHLELVAEIPKVEKLSVQDRLELARKRRSQQLKRWERDKDVEFGPPPPKKKPQRARPVKFEPRIILLEAASRGDPIEVKKMLDYGVDPNLANDDGLTALHQACIDECEDIAMLLVEYGANINATDRELWTPLHAAAACGNLIMIEFLVDHGGDVAAINADGNLPVDLVEDDKEIKDFLYDEMDRKGFDEDKIDELMALREKWMLEDIKDAVEKKRDLEAKDLEGATALHVAAANGYVEVLEFLLENGADVDVTDKDGWMPIHAAGCWGNEKAIELLVEHGSELECKTPLGETPLDLCEDPDTRQFIVDLKNKIKTNKFKVKNTRRKRSNSRSLSVKRSSLKEKISISQGEAKAEAILRKHPELAFLIQNDKTNGVQKQMEVSMDEKDVNTEKHNSPEKTNVQVKDDWKPAPKELEVAERRVMTNSETDSEKTEGSGRKLVGIKVVLKGNEEKENIEPRSQGVQDKKEEKSELNITDKMAVDTVIPAHDNISTNVQAKNTTDSRETVVQKQKTVEPSEKLSQKPSLPKVPPPRSPTLGHRQLPANSPPHSPPITAKETGMGKDNKLDQVLVISQPQRAPTTKPLSELISNKNIAQPSSTPKSTKTRAAPPVPRTSGSASGRSHIPLINSSADTSGYPDSFSKRKSRDSRELPEAAINQLAKDVKESRAVSSTDVKLSTQGTTARYTPLAPTPPQGPHDQVATLDVHSKTTNVLQPSAQTNNKNINNQPNEPAGRISAQDKVKVERHKKSCCTVM